MRVPPVLRPGKILTVLSLVILGGCATDRVTEPPAAAARIGDATDRASDAIARRFGKGAVDGKIQAHVIAVERNAPSS